jgi:hypothetical protein
MLEKRHEALREILRERLGEDAARLMPPLDIAHPGDVYVDPPVGTLLMSKIGHPSVSALYLGGRWCAHSSIAICV